ncbi:hypothetical protein RRG08_000145 [Elysia crispata]|uniref:Uncharacterized protein n=1 Tax=Elysia crispata TaxID=231223 RepID=A0AAE0YVG9_9GAST|nr:hypothetical protein RRG08_000145 [Elysia crispata]
MSNKLKATARLRRLTILSDSYLSTQQSARALSEISTKNASALQSRIHLLSCGAARDNPKIHNSQVYLQSSTSIQDLYFTPDEPSPI